MITRISNDKVEVILHEEYLDGIGLSVEDYCDYINETKNKLLQKYSEATKILIEQKDWGESLSMTFIREETPEETKKRTGKYV